VSKQVEGLRNDKGMQGVGMKILNHPDYDRIVFVSLGAFISGKIGELQSDRIRQFELPHQCLIYQGRCRQIRGKVSGEGSS